MAELLQPFHTASGMVLCRLITARNHAENATRASEGFTVVYLREHTTSTAFAGVAAATLCVCGVLGMSEGMTSSF